MRIHFVAPQDTADPEAVPDTLAPGDTVMAGPKSTAYDTIWSEQEVPTQPPTPLEEVMLRQDKLYVVLAVVLLIWFGLAAFLFQTNRRLKNVERKLEEDRPGSSADRP